MMHKHNIDHCLLKSSQIAMQVFLHQNEIGYSHYKCENTILRLRDASSKKKRNIEWRAAKAVFCLILMFCFSLIPYAFDKVIVPAKISILNCLTKMAKLKVHRYDTQAEY